MKYKILEIHKGYLLDGGYVVTQEGKVAYWNDSAGWTECVDQCNFRVLIEA